MIKNQHRINWEVGKFVVLAALALILVVGWSQRGDLARAQSPDGSGGDVILTDEPNSPIATPTPDDEMLITPPAKIIITIEPVETTEPTDEPQPTDEPEPTVEPDPTNEPDDVGVIIEPPSKEEMGDPVKDDTAIATNDREDSEDDPIDIFDLAFVASRYGSDDSAADVNMDGTVDIFDLTILASHYGQTEPGEGVVIVTPEPDMEVSGVEFGEFDVSLEPDTFDLEAQYYVRYRPLRIGTSINYFKVYDSTDYNSAPDPYALVSVGGVSVRTPTMYNTYRGWPYWRLGWWRYYSFPWAPSYTTGASYYSLPISVELRDDDGYVCYGYYGCRHQCQYIDVSPPRYNLTKRLTMYPSQCKIVDEAGTTTYGTWINSNRCRVHLQSWGNKWPRGYISYSIDAQWD